VEAAAEHQRRGDLEKAMSSGYGGEWSDQRQVEQARRRQYLAQIAGLEAEAAAMRQQAKAMSRIARVTVTVDVTTPARTETSDGLARHAERLRASVAAAREAMHREAAAAWSAHLHASLPKVTPQVRPAAPRKGRDGTGRGGPADAADDRFAREQAAAAIENSRQVLAGNLARCDPRDVERLERLACGLTDAGPLAALALLGSVAESVERRKRAVEAAATRERLRVIAQDTLPGERPTLLELITRTPDPDLPDVARQVSEAVDRADRIRSRDRVAQAAAEALRELGCEVGPEFGVLLADADADAAIVAMRGFPGYGLRVKLSGKKFETLVVRQADPGGAGGVAVQAARDAAVQHAVCGQMDLAWESFGRVGVSLEERRRIGAGAEPVAVVDPARWAKEFCPTVAGAAASSSSPAAVQWHHEEPVLRELRHDG